MNFQQLFRAYADENSKITLTQINKWFVKAKIINRTLTTTDIAVQFNKFKKNSINYRTFNHFLVLLSKRQNTKSHELKSRLITAGPPDVVAPAAPPQNVFERLTDPSKYTGTQKQNFDASGKGKGMTRRPRPPDGYVFGYKNKDTYDKKHPFLK